MQELNNLIGELDLFQREIDESKQRLNNNENNGSGRTTTTATIDIENTNNCMKKNEKLLENENFADNCSLTSYASINNNNKNDGSNSELNHLVTDTECLNVAGGYENPTFAHFAVTSPNTALDTTTYSDNGSNVVVIYDHQIPMTPDIDYVKQNSEIVVLRTKDPQQQTNMLLPHETRELKQLTANAYAIDDDDDAMQSKSKNVTKNLATVKQRLSSFRATSEQQLQLLGLKQQQQLQQQQQQQQQHDKGMILTTTTTTTPAEKLLKLNNDRNSLPIKHKSNIEQQRPKAAQKPMTNLLNLSQQQQIQINAAIKNNNKCNFKADLDAKVRKQKEKLLKQQQQQHIDPTTTLSLSSIQKKNIPTTEPLVVNSRYNNNSMNLNVSYAHNEQYHQQDQITHIPSDLTNGSLQQQQNGHCHSYHNNNNNPHHHHHQHHHKNKTTTTISSSSSSSYTPSIHNLNYIVTKCVPVATPVVPPTTDYVPKSAATMSKPCILPRPASLTGDGAGGGSTRIARRASINAAKPPPPVRRSSSVTPGHNSRTTSPHQTLITTIPTPPTPPPIQQQQYINKSPLQQHNSNKIYAPATNHTQIDTLPPPPEYLLEDTRQTTNMPTATIANFLPNSTMKVVETVKNLAALRHQPASPILLRRQQQQQPQEQQANLQKQNPIHQNLYCATITTSSNTANYPGNMYLTREECDYAAYYNPYVEVMHNLASQSHNATTIENNAAFCSTYASSLPRANSPSLSCYEPTYYMQMQSNSSNIILNPAPNPIYQPSIKKQQQQQQQQQRQHDIDMQQMLVQHQQQYPQQSHHSNLLISGTDTPVSV